MHLRRDEMAIRNMMQMKQAGFEANLRDGIDDKILHFDFRQPNPEEVAAAQAQEQQQQQQGGQQVAKGEEWIDDPHMLMKRTEFDSSRGSTIVPSAAVTAVDPTNDIPPLRTISQNKRTSSGTSPDMERRVEGTPTGSGVKTDKRDFKSPQEKAIDSQLREMEKRKGLGGSRDNSQ